MPSFDNIEFLFGLALAIPLALLFVYVLRWKKSISKQMGDKELVRQLTQSYSPKNFSLKFYLELAAIILCILAAANLRSSQPGKSGGNMGIDIMVALDVSNSMLAQDIQPNRLERAKQLLNNLIDRLGDNQIGLVIFAGQAFLQMPLTSDLSAAKMYIANASPNAVPEQGTVVGDALRTCNASLDTREKKYKAIILISDGETHDKKTPDAVKELKDNNVILYTVGIGSPEGSPILDPATNDYKKDENGNTVVSKLNEKELQSIAGETSGVYYRFTTADEVAGKLADELGKMDKKQTGGGYREYTAYFQWFVLSAILLLLLEVIVPERKMKWI